VPVDAPPRLEITPFPTATAGAVLIGELLPPDTVFVPEALSLPTAVSIGAQATAAPNFATCPPRSDAAALEASAPRSAGVILEEAVRYLAAGGDAGTLLDTLRRVWRVIPADAPARADIDYTGEGVSEVLLPIAAPDGSALLAVLGCRDGTVAVLLEVASDTAETPRVLAFADVNRDRRNDLLYSALTCPEQRANDSECDYLTQLVTWSAQRSRFVELMPPNVVSASPPTASDFDNDEVVEVIVRQERRGTAQTGPLRTGTTVYDWNGTQYVPSIVELDAPRFKIQVLHEGDKALLRGDTASAKSIYQTALTDTSLRFWFNDEPDVLQSYAFYRLLQTQVLTLDPNQTSTYAEIGRTYPQGGPVYAELARVFYESFTTQANVGSACAAVGAIIAQRPEALAQLNRYGTRNPTYTATDLCPF
jgi:hypothetical protein